VGGRDVWCYPPGTVTFAVGETSFSMDACMRWLRHFKTTRPRRESARIGRPAALPTPGDRSRLLQPCGLGRLAPSLKFGAFVGFSGRRDTPKGGVDPPQGGGLPRLERGGRSECVQPKTAHLRSVNAFSRPQILFPDFDQLVWSGLLVKRCGGGEVEREFDVN